MSCRPSSLAPKDAVVLVDEAYHHFVEDPGRSAFSPALLRTWWWCAPFQDLWPRGHALGYAVSPKRVASMRADDLSNASPSRRGPRGLREPEHAEDARQNSKKKWLVLHREPAHHAFGDQLRDDRRAVTELGEAFKAKGLKVGRRFPALPHWLRISIGTDAETRAFLVALREIVPARPA
jgi:hypothetical protein